MDKIKKQQDIEDYNHASKGVSNGRNHGFATPDHLQAPHQNSDNREADIDLAFSALMEQQEKRRIEFERRMNELNDRYAALDEASLRALMEAQQNLQDIQDRANRAKDGRRVYVNEQDGQVYDEQGSVVGHDEIDGATWDANAPTYQQFESYQVRVAEAAAFRDKVQRIGERLNDDLTEDDLNLIEQDIDAIEADMPPNLIRHYPSAAAIDESAVQQKGSLSSTFITHRIVSNRRGEGRLWLA